MQSDSLPIAADVLAIALALGLAVRFAVAPMWPTAAALALAVVLVLGLRALALRVQSRELAEVRAMVEKANKEAGEAHRAMAALLEISKSKRDY